MVTTPSNNESAVKNMAINNPSRPSFFVNSARNGSDNTSRSTSKMLFIASAALQMQNAITPRKTASNHANDPPIRKLAPTEIIRTIKPLSTEINWANPFKS